MSFWFRPTPGRLPPGAETLASADAGNRPALPLPIVYDERSNEPNRWEYRCLLIDPEREQVPQERRRDHQ